MQKHQINNNQVALVVDDDITNRMVLSRFLKKLSYDVVESENGKQAIDDFLKHSPDIVFMDVMMPEMNGYEATNQIKYLCKSGFVPVIFLTALNDSEDLAKCIDAGGDDFLSKPLEMTVLRAKIHAIERIRNLYRQVQGLNKTLKNADQIANKIFEQAVFTKNVKIDSIETWFNASDRFNNDLFLVSHTPSNGINILFGHFNTKGLSSAVGALPASEVFRSMSNKGFSPDIIVQKINAKLHDLLPSDITLSMVFININEGINQALICNYNMPDVQFVNGHENTLFFEQSPIDNTIGKTAELQQDVELQRVNINEHTHIILGSSNIFSCKNDKDETYSKKHYLAAIKDGILNGNILSTLKHDIMQFADATTLKNTLSLIEIPCSRELISNNEAIEKEFRSKKSKVAPTHPTNQDNSNHQVQFCLNVSGSSMRTIDPVPTLINNIESVTSIKKHQEVIFTVLTELYVNALDHGILNLDSKIKQSPDGFYEYYQTRDKKLQELSDGHISIEISLQLNNERKQLCISIEDSGNGFDTSSLSIDDSNVAYSGRGIKLIRGLCESMSFNEKGNRVEAIYQWQ